MDAEDISVIEAAKQLHKCKQTVFKILKRLSIERTLKIGDDDARGQKVAYITANDYDRIREYVVGMRSDSETPAPQVDLGWGFFYLIQLEPHHDPGRFKLGFATNIEERLRSHRTAAPYSKVLRTWNCKSLWEKTAIDCASQGCDRLHTEVFRVDAIDEVVSRLDKFFDIMPRK